MTYRALGHLFEVQADEPLRTELRRALSPLSVDREDPDTVRSAIETIRVTCDDAFTTADSGWTVVAGDQRLRATSPGVALARTLELINRCAAMSVESDAPLHAAAVVHPSGPTVALAGRSGSGKSTLAAAAVLAGWGFLAEEVAAVATNGFAVAPYHRPIGLRRGGADAIGIDIGAAGVDRAVGMDGADGLYDLVYPWPVPAPRRVQGGPLAAVALVSRQPGPPELVPLTPPAALAELIEHVVVPRDDDVVAAFRALEALVRAVPVSRICFDTPDTGLGLVEQLIGLG